MQTLFKYSGVTILLFSLLSCTRYTNISKSKLVWEENFNQKGHFDTSRWSKIPRGTSDWNRKMSDFDSCYAMRDGKLILRGIVNHSVPEDTASILTGGVYTKDKVSFGYGRLEVRARLYEAKGAWPAIWMLPQGGSWPRGGEIDIMERLNSDTFAYQTVHSYFTYNLKIKNPPSGGIGTIDPNDFNTYAVERYADSLVFYINNNKTFTYPRIDTDKEGQWPFNDREFYLLIDMQLGGSWVGEVDTADLPVEMEIDWVRFYKFNDEKKGQRK